MDGITESRDMSLSKHWEIEKDREAWCAAVHGIFQARVLEWDAIAFSESLRYLNSCGQQNDASWAPRYIDVLIPEPVNL